MSIPKNNNLIGLVFDQREFNSQLVQKPFPLSTVDELLYETTRFRHISMLDLNMGYLSMMLDKLPWRMVNIIFPFRIFE